MAQDPNTIRYWDPYCRQWCEIIDAVSEYFVEELEGETQKGTAYKYNNYVVEFPNRSRINCMSSNPRRFRSKGGDVCLDEFDWHDDPEEMYAIRRHKLAQARHRRREKNLQLRQPTLPFTSEEPVA